MGILQALPLRVSGPRINYNEGAIYTLQKSRTVALASDSVQPHAQDTPFSRQNLVHPARSTFIVFYAQTLSVLLL